MREPTGPCLCGDPCCPRCFPSSYREARDEDEPDDDDSDIDLRSGDTDSDLEDRATSEDAIEEGPEQLEGFNCSAGFCGGLVSEVKCANCGRPQNVSAGQFVRDNRWVCSEACRKSLIERDSYDDLAASGGIVEAP